MTKLGEHPAWGYAATPEEDREAASWEDPDDMNGEIISRYKEDEDMAAKGKVSVAERDFLVSRIRSDMIKKLDGFVEENCKAMKSFGRGHYYDYYGGKLQDGSGLRRWLSTDACGEKQEEKDRVLRSIRPSGAWMLERLENEEVTIEYEMTECMIEPRTTVRFDGYDAEVKRLRRKESRRIDRDWKQAGEEAKELHAYIVDLGKLLHTTLEGVWLTTDLAAVLETFRNELEKV